MKLFLSKQLVRCCAIALLTLLALSANHEAYSQITYTSRDNKANDWATATHWTFTGGASPTQPGNPTTGSASAIRVYGYTRSEVALTVNNGSPTITIYDTLFIIGNFNLGQGTLNVPVGGVLVVTGNLTVENGLNQLNIYGNVAVKGNLNVTNGAVANPNNHLYVYGTTSASGGGTIGGCNPYSGCTPASKVQSQSQLQAASTSLYNFVNSNGVLPVELIFFKAIHDDGINKLSWATATELNFDYFNIERSYDGLTFESIGKVKGNGTTKQRHDYNYADPVLIQTTTYYRLQSIDFDRFTETFNVIAVTIDHHEGKNITWYPIPLTNSEISFQLNFLPKTEIVVTVVSVTGAEKFKGIIKPNETQGMLKHSLDAGVYIVKINSVEFNKVSRIVVQ